VCKGVNWTQLAHNMVQWRALLIMVTCKVADFWTRWASQEKSVSSNQLIKYR